MNPNSDQVYSLYILALCSHSEGYKYNQHASLHLDHYN